MRMRRLCVLMGISSIFYLNACSTRTYSQMDDANFQSKSSNARKKQPVPALLAPQGAEHNIKEGVSTDPTESVEYECTDINKINLDDDEQREAFKDAFVKAAQINVYSTPMDHEKSAEQQRAVFKDGIGIYMTVRGRPIALRQANANESDPYEELNKHEDEGEEMDPRDHQMDELLGLMSFIEAMSNMPGLIWYGATSHSAKEKPYIKISIQRDVSGEEDSEDNKSSSSSEESKVKMAVKMNCSRLDTKAFKIAAKEVQENFDHRPLIKLNYINYKTNESELNHYNRNSGDDYFALTRNPKIVFQCTSGDKYPSNYKGTLEKAKILAEAIPFDVTIAKKNRFPKELFSFRYKLTLANGVYNLRPARKAELPLIRKYAESSANASYKASGGWSSVGRLGLKNLRAYPFVDDGFNFDKKSGKVNFRVIMNVAVKASNEEKARAKSEKKELPALPLSILGNCEKF